MCKPRWLWATCLTDRNCDTLSVTPEFLALRIEYPAIKCCYIHKSPLKKCSHVRKSPLKKCIHRQPSALMKTRQVPWWKLAKCLDENRPSASIKFSKSIHNQKEIIIFAVEENNLTIWLCHKTHKTRKTFFWNVGSPPTGGFRRRTVVQPPLLAFLRFCLVLKVLW